MMSPIKAACRPWPSGTPNAFDSRRGLAAVAFGLSYRQQRCCPRFAPLGSSRCRGLKLRQGLAEIQMDDALARTRMPYLRVHLRRPFVS